MRGIIIPFLTMESLKEILAQLEQRDIENGDFERKAQARKFYQALYGLNQSQIPISDSPESDAQISSASPKRLRLDKSLGDSNREEENQIIQSIKANGWRKSDFQVFFDTCPSDRVRPVLMEMGLSLGVVEMCSLCQSLTKDPWPTCDQFKLICETLVAPNLLQEDVIIREVAQSVISLAEIQFDLVVQSVLGPLFQVDPVAHPDVIFTFMQDACLDDGSRLFVFKTFLQRRELLQDPDLTLLECFLQGLDPQSTLPQDLLLSLCPVLLASSAQFNKNAKFGKLLLSICKKLPSILDQRILDSFQSILATHQTFVRIAAQKELKSRTAQ